MPPAAFIVPAVASIAGAAIQSGSNNRAARYQRDANSQAQSMERARDAEDRRRYDQQYEAQMAQRRLRDQVARQILSEHGINIPGAAVSPNGTGKGAGYTGTGPSVTPGAPPSLASISPGMDGAPPAPGPSMGPGAASQMFDSQAGTPSSLMSAPTAPAAPQPGMAPPSMAGLTNWSDELWRKQ